jgi:coronin-1B/1C/6
VSAASLADDRLAEQKASQIASFEQHGDQIQSFSWDGQGKQIATTCKDKLIRVFDPRTGVAQQAPGFEGAKGSKCTWITKLGWLANLGFAPNGMRQLVLLDPRKFGTPVFTLGGHNLPLALLVARLTVCADIDQSAGQLSSYYDEDTSILFVGGKGDGNIRYFEITEEVPQAYFLRCARAHAAVPSHAFLRACAPCRSATSARPSRRRVSPSCPSACAIRRRARSPCACAS